MKWFERRPGKKKSHFANLVCVALADGRIDESELDLLREFGRRIGLADEAVSSILKRPDKVRFIRPSTPKLRLRQLIEIIMMMLADGEIDLAEYRLCSSIAIKLEFDPAIAIPRIVGLLKEHDGDDLKIDLERLESELSALSAFFPISPPPRPAARPQNAAVIGCLVLLLLLIAAVPGKIFIDRQLETAKVRRNANLIEEADGNLRDRKWWEARQKYSEVNRFYREQSRPSQYRETMAIIFLKRAICSFGEARFSEDLTDKRKAELLSQAEQDMRDAITSDPGIRFRDLDDLCKTHHVRPSTDTETRFLAMRLKVAPEVYLKNRQSILKQGIIDVDVDEAGRASIRIDYNQDGLTVENHSSRTDHKTIASLEKEVKHSTARILKETIEFIGEGGGGHLLDEIRISCFHGVQSMSAKDEPRKGIDALNNGGVAGMQDLLGMTSKAILIYQTTTTFSDEGATRTTRITLNRIPALWIGTERIGLPRF